jgi:hypothetical protein
MDNSRTRRLAVEISYFEAYRYAQLQNRELKTELIRVNFNRYIFKIFLLNSIF